MKQRHQLIIGLRSQITRNLHRSLAVQAKGGESVECDAIQ
jgi:hypothetical protein